MAFTTDSSGIEYGLVKYHEKCDLQTAKNRIAKPPMRDHSYSVHVFRNVIEPPHEMPQWAEAHVVSFMNDALELSLQSLEEWKLYEKCKVSIAARHKDKHSKGKGRNAIGCRILKRLNENFGVRNLDEIEPNLANERRSIVLYVEQFCIYATQADSTFLYVYNCENPPQGIKSYLNGISGHLDPTKYSRSEELPRINTSMFYIGSAGSFTEMHPEYSLADSVNLIHVGKKKIWIIIAKEDYNRTNRIIAQKLKDLSYDEHNEEEEETKETENCVLPLHHKNLVLTPRLLDEHKIRYEFVVQEAGDLVYVRHGVLHQVVNVGVNVAEAINVGSDVWNLSNELKMLCPCEKCKIDVATNMDVDMSVKVGKLNTNTRMRYMRQNIPHKEIARETSKR